MVVAREEAFPSGMVSVALRCGSHALPDGVEDSGNGRCGLLVRPTTWCTCARARADVRKSCAAPRFSRARAGRGVCHAARGARFEELMRRLRDDARDG